MDAVAWVWIVFILTAGFVLVTLVYASSSRRQIETPPEQVLKARFAKGEIGEEEYVRRLAVLQHDRLLELED